MEGSPAGRFSASRWHAAEPKIGDTIPIPVMGYVHCLVWRWLSEAYPGLADPS